MLKNNIAKSYNRSKIFILYIYIYISLKIYSDGTINIIIAKING